MIPYVQKRGNIYFFRRRVPIDLLARYPGKVLLVSLGTSDYETAKVRAADMTAKTNREFAELRGHVPDEWKPPARLTSEHLSREELENAEGWEQEYTANREYYDGVDAALREERATTDKLLESAGLPTVSQMAFRAVTGGYAAADLPNNSGVLRPSIAGVPTVAGRREIIRMDDPAHRKSLRHVVPSWTARQRANKNAVGRMNKALDLFEQACGMVALQELKKAHGAQFVAFLLDTEKRRFKAKTAHNHASNITALMNIAVKDDLVERNPFDLSFDKNADAQMRGPWTDDQLKQIYSTTLFTDEVDAMPAWQSVKPRDGRALLLILQHTGARIGEIAQLRRGDFLTQSGIKAMRITEEAGTVKTEESNRTVPIADHLLADPWFAEWLAGIMDGKRVDAPAFSSMVGRARGPADTAVQWFREFREYAKLPSGRLEGSHKFRHWIRSALAAKGVGDATADSITGHAAQGSSGRVVYTAAASLPVMLEALNRITYPQLCK